MFTEKGIVLDLLHSRQQRCVWVCVQVESIIHSLHLSFLSTYKTLINIIFIWFSFFLFCLDDGHVLWQGRNNKTGLSCNEEELHHLHNSLLMRLCGSHLAQPWSHWIADWVLEETCVYVYIYIDWLIDWLIHSFIHKWEVTHKYILEVVLFKGNNKRVKLRMRIP